MEWWKEVVDIQDTHNDFPTDVWIKPKRAASVNVETGDQCHDYFKAKDGSHILIVSAWEKSVEKPGKVNFFIAWTKFKCGDGSSSVLSAELIRRKFIGFEGKTKAWKYIAGG